MKPERTYQLNFSDFRPAMLDFEGRRRKAATMVSVLSDYFEYCLSPVVPLQRLRVLDIGGSTGIIDEYLSRYFGSVTGIDIDTKAVRFASETFDRGNLYFHPGDAMKLAVRDETFDVVICSQVYEHVPDARKMIDEIYRVLRPGGVCYFAASTRLMWNEPHYSLPLLSVVPRRIAHWYIRMAGKADCYHELHLFSWELKQLVSRFKIVDYTRKIIVNPDQFKTSYLFPPGSTKTRLARLVADRLYWAMPGYIWLLKKPGTFAVQQDIPGDVWQA